MKKILIVDDEEDVLNLLAKRLSGQGYIIIKAKSGEEAIRKAKMEIPNLILLDIVMPKIDGGEVRHILSEDDITKDIPIVFLTCLLSKEDERREGHAIGKNFFIAKPYNPDELLDMVRDHVR